MKLTCRINGKDYPLNLVQGATFVDNFNETLDSGTIVISQVKKIDDLKPYDDVYIWNSDEFFDGYHRIGDLIDFDAKIEEKEEKDETIKPETRESDGKIDKDPETGEYRISGEAASIAGEGLDDESRYKNPKITLDIAVPYTSGGSETDRGKEAEFEEFGGEIEREERVRYVQIEVSLNEDGSFSSSSEGLTINGEYDPVNHTISISGTALDESQGALDIKDVKIKNSQYEVNGNNNIFIIEIKKEDIASIDTFVLFYRTKGEKRKLSYTGVYRRLGTEYILEFENEDGDKVYLSFTIEKIGEYTCYFDNKNSKGHVTTELENFIDEVDELWVDQCSGKANDNTVLPRFFKHLLVGEYTETMIGLETGLYSYQISLMSETKSLEKIILPNISITQSLAQEEKRSCWFYLRKIINLYSPKIKRSVNRYGKKWMYMSKYSIDPSLAETFDSIWCPEMTLSAPSFKDALSRIMIVKDMIPYVENEMICGMDISKSKGKFKRQNCVNFIQSNMSSSEYVTDARREYGGALSQEKSARIVEYMGFRTPNSPFLSLSDMVLEFRYPVYKINRILMCYSKTATVFDSTNIRILGEKTFICKQDITPLVVQNSIRNALSNDFRIFDEIQDNASPADWHNYDSLYTSVPKEETLAEAAKLKMCTIGYDIGTKTLSGWGTTYEYLSFLWFRKKNSYIENIINLMDRLYPFGCEMTEYQIASSMTGGVYATAGKGVSDMITLECSRSAIDDESIAKKLKSVTFEVDYDAMYNGAIMHSKKNSTRDDIVTSDNCESSLTVLESDGIFERKKLDRLGNKQYAMTARYDDINGGTLQDVGTYDEETDSIIYSREYQVYDNFILATYRATHEYAMKNYFTSVWAKYRTYSYASYGESVQRNENRRSILLISKGSPYKEDENSLVEHPETKWNFLSFVVPTKINAKKQALTKDNEINCGYFTINGSHYLSDINAFSIGTSMCFNIAMPDNISAGTYIKSLGVDYGGNGGDDLKYKSEQLWHSMVESESDAFVQKLGFHVCHMDKDTYFGSTIGSGYYIPRGQRIKYLPKIMEDKNGEPIPEFRKSIKNILGESDVEVCKDNKERLDVTLQFDYFSDTDDIVISSWACKLNNLMGTQNKFDEDTMLLTNSVGKLKTAAQFCYGRKMMLRISKADHAWLIGNKENPILNSCVFMEKVVKSVNEDQGGNYFPKIGQARLSLLRVEDSFNDGSLKIAYSCEYISTIKMKSESKGDDEWDTIYSKTQIITGTLDFKFVKLDSQGDYILEADLTGKTDYSVEGKGPYDMYRFSGYFQPKESYIGDKDPENVNLSNSDASVIFISVDQESYVKHTKNMFIVYSEEPLRKGVEYDVLTRDTLPKEYLMSKTAKVSEVFNVNEDSGTEMTVDASKFPDAKSVSYYYNDGKGYYHFVLGVNIYNEKKFNISISPISKRDMRVFDADRKVVGKASKGRNGQYYEEDQ